MLGNSMHCQSTRTQNNNQCKKIYATNNNKIVNDGTDVQLLPKSDDISGDSSARHDLSICTDTAPATATTPATTITKAKRLNGKSCDRATILLSHSQSHGDIKSALKYIDTGVENDYPPTLSALRNNLTNEEHKLTVSDRNLSNVSISRTVEFIEANGERHNSCDQNYMEKSLNDAVDSAVEESTSSTENNQVSSIFDIVICVIDIHRY